MTDEQKQQIIALRRDGAGYVIFKGSLEILNFKGAAASDQVADASFQVVNRYEVVKGVPVFHAPQG